MNVLKFTARAIGVAVIKGQKGMLAKHLFCDLHCKRIDHHFGKYIFRVGWRPLLQVPLCSRVAAVGLEKFKQLNGVRSHACLQSIEDAMRYDLLKHAKSFRFHCCHDLNKVRVGEG